MKSDQPGGPWKANVVEYGLADTVKCGTSSKLKIRKCHECQKTFASLSALNRHIQHHTGKYTHFCSVCKKGYNNSYNLKLHMRGHEGKGFPCEYCGKLFKTIQSKQYHESEHAGVYRFTCALCDKGFNEKRAYERHHH